MTNTTNTVTCPYCGSRVAVTASLKIEVHFHYDGIPCGGSAARHAAKRAIRAELLSSRKA